MTVFVDFVYARGCSACHSCMHYMDIINAKYPNVIVRYLDINKKAITEFYKKNLVIDVDTAPMEESRKKVLKESGRNQLMGTPTIVVWSDKFPHKAFIVKYGCAGRQVSLAEQDVMWESIMKQISILVDLEDGLVGSILDVVYEDMGWEKW